MYRMQPITTIKMGLLSALLCLNANTALSQTVNDFPRPTIKKGDIPKPKPSIPKADIPKPQSPATPRVNIPSNNPGIALPERPKPQTTIYSFVSYPYQKPDPNGVTHVAMLNDQQQYRMYHWPIAKAPIDPALLKSGALDTLAAMQPAVETFQINQSEKAFSIKTKKGIELQFPDQAFADGLGNPVVGTITLSVQSFQSKTDFASAQLTSSTSNGDALISGGMLNVEAKSGNANLRMGDGKSYKILPEAKDYKRIGEGDTGLNTGGMGAVSPVIFADAAFMQKVEERIVKPTIAGLEKENIRLMLNSNRKVSDRSETAYLHIIGAMLNLLLGHSPSGKPHSVFRSQSAIVDALIAYNKELSGVSKRTLDEKFAAAKRSLSKR